jgi:hypothetical protein
LCGPEVVVYVSPSGNDANPGTLGQPMLTPAGALSRVRAYSAASSSSIAFLEGVYRTGALTLRPADSGLQFSSPDGPGAAKIRTSQVVTGWTQESGSIYRKAIGGVGTPFYTLYEDGVRSRACRTPKLVIDPDFPCSLSTYLRSEGVASSHTTLQWVSGELDTTGYSTATGRLRLISGGSFSWFTDSVPFTAIDAGTRRFTLAPPTRYEIYRDIGSQFFVENAALSQLTEAGEFFYDGTTLYYWAVGGATPDDVTIEVPTAYDVFRLVGNSATDRVQGVTFDGLELGQTDDLKWSRFAHVDDNDGFTDRARGPLDFLASTAPYDRLIEMPQNRHGAIYLENTDNCVVSECHIKNTGLHGVYSFGYSKTHTIEDSWIEQCGHDAIKIEGPYPGGGDIAGDWAIDDCKLNNFGQTANQGSGVYLVNSGGNTITRCDISQGPRHGVWWGAYIDLTPSNCYTRDNVLEYSALSDLMQHSGDAGGAGCGGGGSIEGGPYNTNTTRQVTIDGVRAHPSMVDVVPKGIYNDVDTWGQVFENVEVTDTQGAQFYDNILPPRGSGEHTITNCSFLADGSANPSFNPALMDYANIGLRPTFPSFAS